MSSFRGVKMIEAMVVTVLEGSGVEGDPYREVQYVIEIRDNECRVLCALGDEK